MTALALILCIPTAWELWNDRKGDLNKFEDALWRLTLMAVTSVIVGKGDVLTFLVAFNLSLAIHFLVFDYAINFILIKNGTLEPPRGVKYHWFTYKAKAGVIDNISWWRNLNQWVKLGIRVGYFAISIILFFTI